MQALLGELYRRNRWLTGLGWLLLGGFGFAFAASFFDSRTVLGLNTWIKPMKFCLSVTAYVWTLAWLLHYVRDHQRSFAIISAGVTIVMFVEMLLLYSQAARGVQSHFNFSAPYDAMVFGLMGVMIYLSLFFDLWAFGLFAVAKPDIPRSYLWGIRLGLLLFIVFALQGQLMIARMGHSVGVPDGGAGLPILNWSTQGGDLRIAHALGLHALQLVPFAGWLLHRYRDRFSLLGRHPTLWTIVFAATYAAVCFTLLLQALAGRSLIPA